MGSLKSNNNLLPELYQYLLATVTNAGEMGTVMNWENHILQDTGVNGLKKQFPPRSVPQDYRGKARIIIPTNRTSVDPGEVINLKVIILDKAQRKEANLFWRVLGSGPFQKLALTHIARGVYRVRLPAIGDSDIEYYVKVISSRADTLYYPATAPELNQTIVSASLVIPTNSLAIKRGRQSQVHEIIPIITHSQFSISLNISKTSEVKLVILSPDGKINWSKDLGIVFGDLFPLA